MLALVMGIGMVALAFTAVYRGASGNRQDQVPPPATTGVDATQGRSTGSRPPRPPSSAPPVSAGPRALTLDAHADLAVIACLRTALIA